MIYEDYRPLALTRENDEFCPASLASRVAPNKRPFQTVIRRLGDTSVEFEPQVFNHLQELVRKGDLRFDLR
jgi:hypothetical protein